MSSKSSKRDKKELKEKRKEEVLKWQPHSETDKQAIAKEINRVHVDTNGKLSCQSCSTYSEGGHGYFATEYIHKKWTDMKKHLDEHDAQDKRRKDQK